MLPSPVQAPMMHLRARIADSVLRERVISIAREEKVMTFARAFASEGGDSKRFELSVGDATLGFTPDELAELLGRLLGPR